MARENNHEWDGSMEKAKTCFDDPSQNDMK